MNLLYVDESGTPSANDTLQTFSIVGVNIELRQLKSLTKQYLFLHNNYYPSLYKDNLRSQPTMKGKVALLESRENKNILQPRNLSRRNIKFITKVIELCEKEKVKILSLTVLKDKLKKRADAEWLYPHCLQILSDLYSKFLRKSFIKTEEGIIILDSRDQPLDDFLALSQSRYMLWNKRMKQINNIPLLPFFTRSHLSFLMQIAHYFAHITNASYQYVYYNEKKYQVHNMLWKKLSNMIYGIAKGKEIIVWR